MQLQSTYSHLFNLLEYGYSILEVKDELKLEREEIKFPDDIRFKKFNDVTEKFNGFLIKLKEKNFNKFLRFDYLTNFEVVCEVKKILDETKIVQKMYNVTKEKYEFIDTNQFNVEIILNKISYFLNKKIFNISDIFKYFSDKTIIKPDYFFETIIFQIPAIITNNLYIYLKNNFNLKKYNRHSLITLNLLNDFFPYNLDEHEFEEFSFIVKEIQTIKEKYYDYIFSGENDISREEIKNYHIMNEKLFFLNQYRHCLFTLNIFQLYELFYNENLKNDEKISDDLLFFKKNLVNELNQFGWQI